MNVEKSFAQQHYADLSDKPFFTGLVEYIISGPVVAMVWEGKDVVNVIHGSDSVDNGKKEIALWFPEGLAEWRSNLHPWIYEA
nr:unnamed protein product [Digitaria exilis]